MFLEKERFILKIDESWSNDYSFTIRGWFISKNSALEKMEISADSNRVPITAWYPRPDVTAKYPQFQTQKPWFCSSSPSHGQH